MAPSVASGMDPALTIGVASAIVLGLSIAFIFMRSYKAPGAGDKVAAAASVQEHDSRKRITILFGTQTGTAERFSKELTEEVRRKYGKCCEPNCIDLEDYDYECSLEREEVVMFLVATYGDGEPTDGGANFHTWLLEKAEAEEGGGALDNVTYGVFGLGNSQYEHFNAVGKQVDKAMNKLGAKRVGKRGEGDDDNDIEDDFAQWRDDVFSSLEAGGVLEHAEDDSEPHIEHYEVIIHETGDETDREDHGTHKGAPKRRQSNLEYSAVHPYYARVVANQELHTPRSGRSCVHIEFETGCRGMAYTTGDHLGVYGENTGKLVDAAIACMGLPAGMLFDLEMPHESSALPPPFPGPVSLRSALTRHADLQSPPRRSALLALAAHASDPAEAARLNLLGSSEGRDEYHAWVHDAQRSLVEVMQAFPSAKPPLGVFFGAVAPRLLPRFYSISSSPLAAPGVVSATVAVVCDPSPTGRLHEGVCSTWMARASVGSVSAPVFIRGSTFRLPEDPLAPVVMVGPGTGIAPFRGFLQERQAMMEAGKKLGPAVLFFGCRTADADFIYEGQLKEWEKSGVLTTLHVAFSRAGETKDYVQHHLARHGTETWALVRDAGRGGRMYVCGDSRMEKDVRRALVAVVAAEEGCSGHDAEDKIKELQHEGRYLRDVW